MQQFHVPEVRHVIEQAGVKLVYLPPYSPDLNPIEEAFSKVKGWIRSNDIVWRVVGRNDNLPMIYEAFYQITTEDCYAYFNHPEYV